MQGGVCATSGPSCAAVRGSPGRCLRATLPASFLTLSILHQHGSGHAPLLFKTIKDLPWPGGPIGGSIVPNTKSHRFNSWSGHIPRFWVGPWSEHVQGGNQSMFLSLSPALSSPLSLKTINRSSGEDLKKKHQRLYNTNWMSCYTVALNHLYSYGRLQSNLNLPLATKPHGFHT